MAKVNRGVIGTMHCVFCGGLRTVHETAKGPRKGYLYTRCISCTETRFKCIQKADPQSQADIRNQTDFRDSFELDNGPAKPLINEPKPQETLNTPKTSVNSRGSSKSAPQNETPIRSGSRPIRSGLIIVTGFIGTLLLITGAIMK
ncbi:MAG: hypothetical protein ACI882_002288 [Reinekea sp.]|jgi:hypothetical protein